MSAEAGSPNRPNGTVGKSEAEILRGDRRVLRYLVEGDEDRPVKKGQTMRAALSEAQIRHTFSVIPASYFNLSCWTCRIHGHSTFISPYFSVKQCLYFAYRYFLYQIQSNPQMAKYFEGHLQWRHAKDNSKSGVSDKLTKEHFRNVGSLQIYKGRRPGPPRPERSVST